MMGRTDDRNLLTIHTIHKPEIGKREIQFHGIGPPEITCVNADQADEFYVLKYEHPSHDVLCFMCRRDLGTMVERIWHVLKNK